MKKVPNFAMSYAYRLLGVAMLIVIGMAQHTSAVTPPQNPQSGSVGVQGTVQGPPPTTAPTIATPANGSTFTNIPITVSGLCTTGLLVKVFANSIFVGSVVCSGGSYSLQVDLFSGLNQLVARQYDALGQQSPDSSVISVNFNDAQFAQFGSRVTLTSQYAEKGANPGQTLTWPVSLSGGTGPYALSTDWGDGSATVLQSVSYPGEINLAHVYTTAGTYNVVVKATDTNGTTAFLQVVGVSNGEATATNTNGSTGTTTIVKHNVLWTPVVAAFSLSLLAFWLGRRFELSALRKRIEKGWHS